MDEILQTHKEYKLYTPYSEIETIEEKNITKMEVNFIDLQEAFDFTSKINTEFGKHVNTVADLIDKVIQE